MGAVSVYCMRSTNASHATQLIGVPAYDQAVIGRAIDAGMTVHTTLVPPTLMAPCAMFQRWAPITINTIWLWRYRQTAHIVHCCKRNTNCIVFRLSTSLRRCTLSTSLVRKMATMQVPDNPLHPPTLCTPHSALRKRKCFGDTNSNRRFQRAIRPGATAQ